MDYKSMYISLWMTQLNIINQEHYVSDTEAEIFRALDKATDIIWHNLLTKEEQEQINEEFQE